MNEPDRMHPAQNIRQLAKDAPNVHLGQVAVMLRDSLEELSSMNVLQNQARMKPAFEGFY